MSISLIFIFLFKIFCLNDTYKENLIEKNEKMDKNKKTIYFNNQTNKRKLSQKENIRIYVDRSYLRNTFFDNSLLNIYFNSLVKAKNTLEKLIKVERESNLINIEGLVSIEKNHFNPTNFDKFFIISWS